ncbi:hypothetical protein BG011_001182 [Mortierella polycephala]|uniref:Snurportin-1 n=1 Tax=Mortierella polycephala TaxID=41804 RepID=A0A9P6QJ43_9FUNG|nr:hypothetical protein BG011_001182 [Mortierella polycephala]
MTTHQLLPTPAQDPPPCSQGTNATSSTQSTAFVADNSMAAVAASATATPAAATTKTHVSHATVEALGDWLLESATVQPAPAAHEQRRRQSYKSSALINKTMKQSQEERRRLALAEQAKKRYQFTNHARKLAQFASGQPSGGSSSDSDEGDDQDDDADDDNEDDDDDNEPGSRKGKRNKRSNKAPRKNSAGNEVEEDTFVQFSQDRSVTHKRRLSSGSEPESTTREEGHRKDKKVGMDSLSPKKPRLQKKPSTKLLRRKKDRNPFRDQLMIPEAMTDIPVDLDTSYYIVPLPIGHRCFVISADGKTMARLPSGQPLVSPFDSSLPAGSSQYRGNRRSDYCILDCVYSSVTRTFWTIDIMCWRGHPVYECETEFRFWWLRGKLAEIESQQTKWIQVQTREWEQGNARAKQKKAKQAKRRQEKAAAASIKSGAMEICAPTSQSALPLQGERDDGGDEADFQGMDTNQTTEDVNKFWPIAFTPLPYFNASVDLVRLLAEAMHQPAPSPSLIISAAPAIQPSLSTFFKPSPKPSLAITKASSSISATLSSTNETSNGGDIPHSSTGTQSLANTHGTMALTGDIAAAAAIFPAHDATQRTRQNEALIHERAAGLVFFNKKTMYVLGSTPLCGWVTMDQIGDVFFGEEGGIGPVPGTSAVEGREVEMEDALERIRI